MSVRILIADDNSSIRRLLRRILEEHSGWQICGEAATGPEAVRKAGEVAPDLAIIDLAMPQKNGLEAARDISAISPSTRMLLLTVQEVSVQLVDQARAAGFRAAVTKGSVKKVVKAMETIAAEGTFFDLVESPSMSERFAGWQPS